MNLRLLNMPTDLLHLKHDTHVHPSHTSQSRNKWDLLNLFSGGKGTQPLQQLVALLRRTVIDASGPNKQAVYSAVVALAVSKDVQRLLPAMVVVLAKSREAAFGSHW